MVSKIDTAEEEKNMVQYFFFIRWENQSVRIAKLGRIHAFVSDQKKNAFFLKVLILDSFKRNVYTYADNLATRVHTDDNHINICTFTNARIKKCFSQKSSYAIKPRADAGREKTG